MWGFGFRSIHMNSLGAHGIGLARTGDAVTKDRDLRRAARKAWTKQEDIHRQK